MTKTSLHVFLAALTSLIWVGSLVWQPTTLSAQGRTTPIPPPTAVPPTAVPPTAVPPTAVPPTAVPVAPTVAPTKAPTKQVKVEPTSPPRERTDTPWPTPTQTSSPTATNTATATATATTTATSTATSTSTSTTTATATSTATSTSTLTPTATATSTPTATPFASSLVLNEFLLLPRNTDWNGDGTLDGNDSWIELYNASAGPVDVSGWQLELAAGWKQAYKIPIGTSIPGNSHFVFPGRETRFDSSSGPGDLSLLFPDGRPADHVTFPQLRADEAFGRSVDGTGPWTEACVPSRNAFNCRVLATITSSYNLPFFREHIADTATLQLKPEVVATNALLALVLALAMGFFGNLLNDALESHEEQLTTWLRPAKSIWARVQLTVSGLGGLIRSGPLVSAGAIVVQAAVLLLVNGLVLAFLDPNFVPWDRDGILLIIALAFSAGLISLTDDAAMYIYLRLHGAHSVIRLHGGNLALVALTTFLSRVTGLAPGLFMGSPAGIEEIDAPALEHTAHIYAVGATAVMAAIAWFASPFAGGDAWIRTVLLLIFAASAQALFFEMLPIQYLHGRVIFQKSHAIWLALFAGATFVFLQTMLNPDGAFVSAFQSSNMRVLAAFVLVFCGFSAGMWYDLQVLDRTKATPVLKP